MFFLVMLHYISLCMWDFFPNHIILDQYLMYLRIPKSLMIKTIFSKNPAVALKLSTDQWPPQKIARAITLLRMDSLLTHIRTKDHSHLSNIFIISNSFKSSCATSFFLAGILEKFALAIKRFSSIYNFTSKIKTLIPWLVGIPDKRRKKRLARFTIWYSKISFYNNN